MAIDALLIVLKYVLTFYSLLGVSSSRTQHKCWRMREQGPFYSLLGVSRGCRGEHHRLLHQVQYLSTPFWEFRYWPWLDLASLYVYCVLSTPFWEFPFTLCVRIASVVSGSVFLLPFGSFFITTPMSVVDPAIFTFFLLPFGSFWATGGGDEGLFLIVISFLLPFGSFRSSIGTSLHMAINIHYALSTPFWEFRVESVHFGNYEHAYHP